MGGFHASNDFSRGRCVVLDGVGGPSSAVSFRNRRHDRPSSAASRSAANFRTLINDTACTGRSRAAGKRTGAQRLPRGLCACRYAANPLLHRSTPGVGSGPGVERRCSRWIHTNGQSGSMRPSRPGDRWHHHLRWDYREQRKSEAQKVARPRQDIVRTPIHTVAILQSYRRP